LGIPNIQSTKQPKPNNPNQQPKPLVGSNSLLFLTQDALEVVTGSSYCQLNEMPDEEAAEVLKMTVALTKHIKVQRYHGSYPKPPIIMVQWKMVYLQYEFPFIYGDFPLNHDYGRKGMKNNGCPVLGVG